MADSYHILKKELNSELQNILDYWEKNTPDHKYGGFVGKIDHYNNIVHGSSKGIILNTRILWAFAAASRHLKVKYYNSVCSRAYNYLIAFFFDTEYDGVFWELDYNGIPINRRKQVYAQAFAIYALSEYYHYSKNKEAKNEAVKLFYLLEKYAKDKKQRGYTEAFKEDWSPIKDMRLSTKDMNASKTMNTHLHVLEAYTSLLKLYDDKNLRHSLKELVDLFLDTFLNSNDHFNLFFDEKWNLLSNTASYGHDIETVWLVIEAAKAVNDSNLVKQAERAAVKVADTFLKEGIDSDGAVMNEHNFDTGITDTDRHWWPQMEALVGLKYAYELTGDKKYMEHSLQIWNFTKKYLIDYQNGEWFFRVNKNGKPYEEDKISMWKAPYHTTRACILMNS
jgi:mannobiose 2-epimerase